jgi:hypothetical protein
MTFAAIEASGLEEWLAGLREELVLKRYRPNPVRRAHGVIRTLSRHRRMTEFGPTAVIGRVEIPQRSSLLPY